MPLTVVVALGKFTKTFYALSKASVVVMALIQCCFILLNRVQIGSLSTDVEPRTAKVQVFDALLPSQPSLKTFVLALKHNVTVEKAVIRGFAVCDSIPQNS